MRRIFLILNAFALFSGIVSGQDVQYKFSQEKPLAYSFKMEGDVSYQYEGAPEEDFKVLAKGGITLDTLGIKEDSYNVRLTPSRTLMQLNNMVLEDITAQETAVSQVISTAVLEIRKNGEISSTQEVKPGILNLSQILMIMPVFPHDIRSGKSWKQVLPAFSLPGVPMCNLEFTYLYTRGTGDASRIGLISNQRINEKRKDGEMEVDFTGLNSSKGEFIFDEVKGEIRNFKGAINLDLQTVFKVPPGAGKEFSTRQSPPLRMRIRINVTLSAPDRLQSQKASKE